MQAKVTSIYEAACDQATQALRTIHSVKAGFTAMALDCHQTIREGGKIMIAGNGGSHADALHFAEELTGKFRKVRAPLAAIALGANAAHITCTGNDFGFNAIFGRELLAWGKPGDIFVGLSTSGNSPNILEALDAAYAMNLHAYGLSGNGGKMLERLGHRCLCVAGENTARVQELHMFLLHTLCEIIEAD